MVDDAGDVALAGPVADLVDADPPKALEWIRKAGTTVGHHPGDDPADGPPGDAQEPGDGALLEAWVASQAA
jgi:hypothetical protein